MYKAMWHVPKCAQMWIDQIGFGQISRSNRIKYCSILQLFQKHFNRLGPTIFTILIALFFFFIIIAISQKKSLENYYYCSMVETRFLEYLENNFGMLNECVAEFDKTLL